MRAFRCALAKAGQPDRKAQTLTAATAVSAPAFPLPITRGGQIVGRLHSLWASGDEVWVAGDLFDERIDTGNLVAAFADAEWILNDQGTFVDRARLAGATVMAAVTVDTDLPLAEADRSWDGPAAASHMLAWATDGGGHVDGAKLGQGFLYRDPDADPNTVGAYKLPVADIINGEMKLIPAGLRAAKAALAGSRGGVKGLTDEDRDDLSAAVSKLDARLDNQSAQTGGADCGCGGEQAAADESPWDAMTDQDLEDLCAGKTTHPDISAEAACNALDDDHYSVTAAASLFTKPVKPPSAWFDDPELPGPTPITVTAAGEVFGHIADWSTCHRSFVAANVCLTPPHSKCQYCQYMLGSVETAEGARVAAGALTVGGGHADLGMSAKQATAHYDNVGSAVALVAAGEDKHGIWVHGALRPGATDDQVYDLMAFPPSGDWRESRPGSGLELIAVTAVNTPGYPISRAHVAAGGATALIVPYGGNSATDFDTPESEGDDLAPDELAILSARALAAAAVEALASTVGLDRASELAALDAIVDAAA